MVRLYISALCIFFAGVLHAQQLQPVQLLCDHRQQPLGVGPAPAFSWEIPARERGWLQGAYRLQVADNPAFTNAWDSGRKNSGQSLQVAYTGRPLQPHHTYYWRVQVWDRQGKPSGWSSTASFTTGLHSQADWGGAQWIGYEELPDSMRVAPGVHAPEKRELNRMQQRPVVPLFRKTFTAPRKVARALAFISGLGQYEMSINGKKAGDRFLAPGWTYYDKRCLYNTYDITELLQQGQNAIGVIAGNGFYNINRERYYKLAIAFGMPKMICKLHITYDDGSHDTLVSGPGWKTAPAPVTFSSIYGGEDYDARLEQSGWDQPGFDDAAWKSALPVKPPQGVLEAERDYPVKVSETLAVQKITQPAPGIYVYDFGQNASGVVELKVKGRRGQTVKLVPAELLNKRQLANQQASGGPYYYAYTLKGEGEETWRPRFTYYGFRYVQVEGAVPDTAAAGGDAPRIALRFLHTTNSAPATGEFTCSNDLFNRIHNLIRWAIKSNLQSVVTDCPHREKLSWLEQDHLMGASIHYNFDIYNLYRKLVADMMDAQTAEGLVPDIAPEYVPFAAGFRDSPEWGSAAVILPWLLYKWYGDTAVMRMAYPMMKKYVQYLQGKSKGGILSHGLGDWFDYGPKPPGEAQLTPKALTATAIYYYDVNLLARMAALLNKKTDAAVLSAQAAAIKQAFNKQFYNAQAKVYSTGSQTAMAMPLCTGLAPEQDRAAIMHNLQESIRRDGKKLTAGDIGFHYLVQALQDGGAAQLLYEMNFRDDVPGYGYQLRKGATALTESWPALEEVSNNHLMLGHIMEWFYNGLAGIRQQEQSVSYRHIEIRPEVVGDITWAKGSFHTIRGRVLSEWKKEGDRFLLHVQVPANADAVTYLPAAAKARVLEGGRPVQQRSDLQWAGWQNGRAVVKTGSGDYYFTVQP